MNPEGKTKASQAALACASEDTRKLNPHLFYKNVDVDMTHPPTLIGDQGKLPVRKPKTRIRQDKPMNKLEQEAFEYLKYGSPLERVRLHGTPLNLRAQSKRFRLASGLWYKPDFTGEAQFKCMDVLPFMEFAIEVKGPHAFRGGFENLKMAATQYPEIRWILMWKDQRQWQFQEVLP